LVDAIPPLQGARGRRRCRPHCVVGDRGYDAAAIRYGVARSSHRSAVGHASHRARERLGPLALGRRAHVCLAQPVSTVAGPVRQTGRHPRGVPFARVCRDLLERTPEAVGNRVTALAKADLENGATVRTDYSISVHDVLKRDAHVSTAGDLNHVLRPGGGRDQGLHFTATLRPAS